MKNRIMKFALVFVLAGAAGLAGGFVYQRLVFTQPERSEIASLLWPNPKVVGEFELVDQYKRPFGLSQLQGKWTFMFFGYSHCPDVCPVTLTVLRDVEEQLKTTPAEAKDVQFAFVSVDPARDTPEYLHEYLSYFNPDFIGLTGSDDNLGALTRQLGVLYKLQEPDSNGFYLVDHTAAILLTDPAGRLVGIFQLPHEGAYITDQFRQIRRFLEAQFAASG